MAPASATPLRFQRLHHALKGDVGVDEVETLLDTLHGDLLRTLERSPSAHTPGGVPQPPAFPAPSSAPSPSTSAYERAAAELLLLGTDATAQLLVDFERESHNAAQALRRAADDPAAASDPLALLPAELRLLEHLHEQRCLLLRCVQQLLAIAFVDSASPLHRVASGRVSLLCGEGLPSRLCTLAAAGAFPGGEASAASRLPRRLRGEGKEGGEGDKERLRVARLECELLELLCLVQAAPLLQLQARLTLAPAEDASLLEQQLGVVASEAARAGPTPPAAADAEDAEACGGRPAASSGELWSEVLPPPAELVAWLEASAQCPPLRLGALRLLVSVAPLAPTAVRAELRRCNVLRAEASPWVPLPLDASSSLLVRLVSEVSLPGASEALAPPPAAAVPPLRFVLERILPAARADASLPSLRLRLRLARFLCGSGSVLELVLDTLRSATGEWERQRQRRGLTAAAAHSSAADLEAVRAELCPAVLGLLLRLLCAAHVVPGTAGPFHAALLRTAEPAGGGVPAAGTPSQKGGAGRGGEAPQGLLRWLALCLMLEPEGAAETEGDQGDGAADDRGGLPMGVLAARCLALLCHAASRDRLAARAASQLLDLAPAISTRLCAWLARAQEAAEGGGTTADGTPLAAVAGHAAAAAELLGASAQAQPELFAALCRGPFRAGETVRVGCHVAVPDGGWGLARPGDTATVIEYARGGGVTLNFSSHEAWYCGRPEQLELCAPAPSTMSSAWVVWADLKDEIKSVSDKKNAGKKKAADGSAAQDASAARAAAPAGPLALLREVLEAPGGAGASGEAPPSLALLRLQLLALGVLRVVWERPAVLAAHSRQLRAGDAFWACLASLVKAAPPPDGTEEDSPDATAAGLLWLRSALALSLVSQELLRSPPPQPTQGGAQPLLVDCGRLPDSAGRTLFRLGLSLPDDLPGLLPLWAGGDELPLLPRLRFADVEALQVRVWRLHERVAQRRGAARAGGGMDGRIAEEELLALREAEGRLHEDLGAGMLLQLERMSAGRPPLSQRAVHSGQAGLTADAAAAHRRLLAAAAASNVAMLRRESHRALVRQWRLVLALLQQPARLPPRSASATLDKATAPSWLSVPTDAAPLDGQLTKRTAQLGRQQHGWADECDGAMLLLRHARLLRAVAMALEQQVVALRGGAAFLWEAADLMPLPRSMDEAAAATGAGGAGAVAKLVDHLCRKMEEVERTPGAVQAAKAPLAATLAPAKAALKERQLLLRRRVASQHGLPLPTTAAGAPATGVDAEADAAAVALLVEADGEASSVRALASELEAAGCAVFGLATPADAEAIDAEAHARRVGSLLDASVAPQPQMAPSSPALKPLGAQPHGSGGGGAAQLLARLSPPPAPVTGGATAASAGLDASARRRLLDASVTQLTEAKAGLAQQGAALRAVRAAGEARGASRRDASHASAGLLRKILLALKAGEPAEERHGGGGARAGCGEAAAQAVGEQFAEAAEALSAAHRLVGEAQRHRAAAAGLWLRHDACGAVAELLQFPASDDVRARELAARLVAAAAKLEGGTAASSETSAPLDAARRVVEVLLRIEEKGEEGGDPLLPAGAVSSAVAVFGAPVAGKATSGGGDGPSETLLRREAEVQEVLAVLALARHHEAVPVHAALQPGVLGAMRALALALAAQLERRAPAASTAEASSGWSEGGAMLLSLVEADASTAAEAAALDAAALPLTERGALTSHVVRVVLAAPATQGIAFAPLLSCLLLLLRPPPDGTSSAGEAAPPELAALAQRLVVGLVASLPVDVAESARGEVSSDSAPTTAELQLSLLAALLPLLPPQTGLGHGERGDELHGLEHALLSALRPAAGLAVPRVTSAALAALLPLCSAPTAAEALLGAGLLSRLAVLVPRHAESAGHCRPGYDAAGERSPMHACWCSALMIASAALAALPQAVACAWLPQAAEFAYAFGGRLGAAIAGEHTSLAGVLEQRAALRFFAQIRRIGGLEVPRLNLWDSLTGGLNSLSRAVLLSPAALQAAMPPSSGNNASMSDTLYSAELRGVLEGSLSSLLPVLPLPLARHEAIEGAFKPSGPRHFQRIDSHPREAAAKQCLALTAAREISEKLEGRSHLRAALDGAAARGQDENELRRRMGEHTAALFDLPDQLLAWVASVSGEPADRETLQRLGDYVFETLRPCALHAAKSG
ncbi:hypothetical protein EMIHUDRAFT_194329 [Emiliania huxleyi CCMP1516]|uniref:HECT domain-containing protein n=2 Tax=Emiliania huxleyi TaxID=2903 RepID=A0A0D3L1B5_EMIH1|nr:hypothetical protein EMIHUDRAFT_194329 [Emiliania huxleyi CCMP1516]EOD41800.1 hypothetical protein EMIHUDRAFT_194329 [Emiliania huxleyi CCMP1516]|eukprot:XP_005794229.1 hypothetical protein EMIHUDRAFT_194329 [Emiliania huxleyi CCMP1516]